MEATYVKGKHTSSYAKARYAYGTARVHAMRIKLFPNDTYKKLLAMDLSEITRFIEESEYKQEVDELARRYTGIDLVEFALHLNLARTFTKLMEMTMGEPHDLIVEYLRRWDVWNIKTILRGKSYGASDDEILRVLIPSGDLSIDFLRGLVRKTDMGEVIAALKGTIYYDIVKDIDFKESLMKLEDELDKFYYKRLIEAISKATGFSLFLRYIKMEIDIVNVKTLFRLKRAGISGPRTLDYVIPGGLVFTDKDLKEMANASFEEFVSKLKSCRYWSAISDVVTERMESLHAIETRLDKFLADYVWRIARFYPISILPILGYMLSKYVELENIRAIVRGKEAKLSEETIRDYIVL